MNTTQRVLVSGGLALLFLALATTAALFYFRSPSSINLADSRGHVLPGLAPPALDLSPVPKFRGEREATAEAKPGNPETFREPPREKLIEEELAEFGEEPGAIYFMSRIREAIVEGNPKFARELLRQMKEEHSESALVAEAESLLEEAGKKGGR